MLNAGDVLDVVNCGEQAGDVVGDVPEVDSLVRAWSCEGRQGYWACPGLSQHLAAGTESSQLHHTVQRDEQNTAHKAGSSLPGSSYLGVSTHLVLVREVEEEEKEEKEDQPMVSA